MLVVFLSLWLKSPRIGLEVHLILTAKARSQGSADPTFPSGWSPLKMLFDPHFFVHKLIFTVQFVNFTSRALWHAT